MKKSELLNVPKHHRLFVFNYVNLIFSALHECDLKECSEKKILLIEKYFKDFLPLRLDTFSNFPIGQQHIVEIYKVLLDEFPKEEHFLRIHTLARFCPNMQHRLLELLITSNAQLSGALEELSFYYNLINPTHYFQIKKDELILSSKYPELTYDMASMYFEMTWIADRLHDIFKSKKIEFNDLIQSENSLRFKLPKNEFKNKSFKPDSNMKKMLERQANDTLKQLFGFDHKSISGKKLPSAVHFIIKNLQNNKITITDLALNLGLSERTLQRRLEEENISFTMLIQFIKVEMAKQMLEVPSLKITEIAQGLGYSESSAFTRSFKKNEGISPLKYRKKFLN